MRIIYIFRNIDTNCYSYTGRTSGWLNPHNWYNAGYIFGYVLQFMAGIGIGVLVRVLLTILGIV